MSASYRFVDYVTRETVNPNNLIFTGARGRPWELEMDLATVRSRVSDTYFKKAPPLVSKYLPFMPVENFSSFVSLEEGGTPLIRSKVLGRELGIDLYFKVEGKNPTGSFKDRGSALEITAARERGASGIAVASTGNMAASCACYAAAAGIPCYIFVPEKIPMAKLAQVISYGGRVVQVKGTYDDAANLAYESAERLGFYLAGDYAYRVEGAKTAAFEVIDQLSFEPPDVVVVPMGCGTNLSAFYKGFREYLAIGLIDRMPRLLGVQAAGASPIVEAFDAGASEVTPWSAVKTTASAIAIGNPLDGLKALHALRESEGSAVGVNDTEMLRAQYDIARLEGLFVESSGAAGVAAVRALRIGENLPFKIRPGAKVVCVMCGDGLKDPQGIMRAAIRPPLIAPRFDAFERLCQDDTLKARVVSFVDPGQTIFVKEPTDADVASRISELLDVEYPAPRVAGISNRIRQILRRGKTITFSDLQDVIQDDREAPREFDRSLFQVRDFSVETGTQTPPRASVSFTIGDEHFHGTSTGVGAVHALISAFREGLAERFPFTLVDYGVTVRGQGTDALVRVEIVLEQGGTSSAGAGTSPDIILASIEAFENAFNGLTRSVVRDGAPH